MFRPILGAVITTFCLCGASTGAAAQDATTTAAAQNAGEDQAAPRTLIVRLVAQPRPECSAPPCVNAAATRGAALPWLYVGQIGLQVYDGYSTTRGLRNGAIESNSIMGRLASHPAALWAAKSGAAFASIYAAERLWRQHRRGQAIAVIVVTNGIMAAVAAKNATVIHAQR
jgi:uncharacterized protein DUF5658